MNNIKLNTNTIQILNLKTISEMNQRHETHLEMESSTHKLLSNNPNEWSKEKVTITGKLE
jgi:hypothetical protein